MPVLEDLSEDECYLLAILDDQSGLDQAEMMWVDEREDDGIFRAWPFQVPWWRCRDERQIDQCVAAGQPVSTSTGPVPIEDVQVGDLVLTHRRRWRRVTDVIHRGQRPVVEVRGVGGMLICTPGHPVWARLPDGSERWLEAWALVESGADWLHNGRWEPVESLVDAGIAEVHDIDVAEDRSFTVADIAVHNCGRSVGKTLGVTMRLWSFPLRRPGDEALITAPELVHLRPVTDLIETQLLDTRLTREMLRVNKGGGSFTHQPFAVRFKNGARIMGRLPQKTGRGVKGQHPSELEMDEAQDYPKPGWTELFATLKKGAGASWRSHGVTRGVQDEFYRFSQPGSGWTVHQITAMHRPTWTDAERQMEVSNYGGGKDDPDYRRNIMGFHGDATNMLFVTSRLMKCVDDDRSSEYNQEEFTHVELTAEQVDALGDGGDPRQMLQFPDGHRTDYSIFWAGMDVGYTADPSEILVFAEYHLSEQERAAMVARKKAHPMEGVSRLKLVTRITLKRFSAPDQMMVLIGLDEFYNLQGLGFDKTGNGLPLYQFIQKVVRGQTPWINPELVEAAQRLAGKIKGYNFSAKEIVDLDDQVEVDELDGDPVKETAMRKLALEQATDVLREYVDHERLWLPWEQDTQQSVIKEFGGQTFSYSRSAIDQHGRPRRVFSTGKFHALDGARMFAMAHSQAGIEAIVNAKPVQESVIVIAGGGY